ncbi:MAG: hypothetical protein M1445_11660 [Bacteroidetes bacterium]|nr:hypothetical protein [Bacteroidota bacterium]MCL6101608.1 hypothetical protein [Bacteroidota bacterium]
MKNLSDHFEEHLLDLSREFYYRSCAKAGIKPILVGRKMSEVKPRFVFLRNSKGAEVKVRHTRTFLFVELSGKEYSCSISPSKAK